MSQEFLPLNSAAGRDAAAASGATGASGAAGGRVDPAAERARKLAEATRQFQALFLMEMMKPMTEELSGSSWGEGGALSGGGNDIYSWFWNEALAGHLAGSWPLPGLDGIANADGGSTIAASATPRGTTRPTPASALSASPTETSPASHASTVPSRHTDTVPAIPADTSSATSTGTFPATPTDTAAAAPARAAADAREPARATRIDGPHESLLTRAGRLFDLPLNLLRAMVAVESGGDSGAVSARGAVGLMQVMPDTAREMGVRDPRDPWENLYAGAKYLSRQVARFDSLEKAVAAYNAGPSAVEAHGGVPPFPETRAYVRRVLEVKARLDLLRPSDA